MPLVMIYQSPRTPELRAKAIAAVTDAIVGAYGVRPEQVDVYFNEVADDLWGTAGQLGSARKAAGGTP